MLGLPPRARSSGLRSFRLVAVSDVEQLPQTELPGLGTLTMPETDARPVPRLSNGDGDHERFAHYAPKDKIVEASVMGTPITASVREGVGAVARPEAVPGVP